MCLGNSVFDGVLGVSITTAKFAPEVIKFGCNCVGVEDSVSEVKATNWSACCRMRGGMPSSIMVMCGEVK